MISRSLRLSVGFLVPRFLLSWEGDHDEQRQPTEFSDDVMACLLRHNGVADKPSQDAPSPLDGSPLVRNAEVVLGTHVGVVGIVGSVGTVGDQGEPATQVGKPLPEAPGNAEPVVVTGLPEFDYLYLAERRWGLPIVVDHEADAANRNSEVLCLFPVPLQALTAPGIVSEK